MSSWVLLNSTWKTGLSVVPFCTVLGIRFCDAHNMDIVDYEPHGCIIHDIRFLPLQFLQCSPYPFASPFCAPASRRRQSLHPIIPTIAPNPTPPGTPTMMPVRRYPASVLSARNGASESTGFIIEANTKAPHSPIMAP